MDIITIFMLATLPAAFSSLLILLNKKKIQSILLKYNSKGRFVDYVRFIWAYKKKTLLSEEEGKLLITEFICQLIANLTMLSWAIFVLLHFFGVFE